MRRLFLISSLVLGAASESLASKRNAGDLANPSGRLSELANPVPRLTTTLILFAPSAATALVLGME